MPILIVLTMKKEIKLKLTNGLMVSDQEKFNRVHQELLELTKKEKFTTLLSVMSINNLRNYSITPIAIPSVCKDQNGVTIMMLKATHKIT